MRARTLAALAAIALSTGCSLLIQPDESRLNPNGADAGDGSMHIGDGTDTPVGTDVVDTGIACTMSCNDNVPCTRDQCDTTTGTCMHVADNSRCPAGQICDATQNCISPPCTSSADCPQSNVCDGAPQCVGGVCVAGTPLTCPASNFCAPTACDPTMGCVNGPAPSCDDGNPCTMDSCDPRANGGAGGCVHAGANCPPVNDTCANATVITLSSGSSTTAGSTVNAMDGVMSPCGGSGGGDVWYQVNYPADQDLMLAVDVSGGGPNADSVLEVRTSCAGDSIVCSDDIGNSNKGSRVWLRAEPAATGTRTIYVTVDSYQAGAESDFVLTASLSAAIAPAVCGGPYFDMSLGGTVLAHSVRGTGHISGSCTPRQNAPEDIYTYAGPTGMVAAQAISAGFTPSLYVRDVCLSGPEAACDTNNPAMISFGYLGGTPAILVVDDMSQSNSFLYTLQVELP